MAIRTGLPPNLFVLQPQTASSLYFMASSAMPRSSLSAILDYDLGSRCIVGGAFPSPPRPLHKHKTTDGMVQITLVQILILKERTIISGCKPCCHSDNGFLNCIVYSHVLCKNNSVRRRSFAFMCTVAKKGIV